MASLSLIKDHRCLQKRDPERSKSHRLDYQVYFIGSGLPLNDAISFAEHYSVAVVMAEAGDFKAVRVVRAHREMQEDVENKDHRYVVPKGC